MAVRKGTIDKFVRNWGSGIGLLYVTDSQTGVTSALTCENAPTARALRSAFGDDVIEGHSLVNSAIHGKEIFWVEGEYVSLGGFAPVEGADPELVDEYERGLVREEVAADGKKG